MGDDPGSSIAFAEKVLSLLDTGSFTTSYKYALLLSIVDATLESTEPDGSAPDVLRGRDLGRRVFARYWHQARPFGAAGPLRQSTQRDVVVKIAELRAELALPEHTSLDAARSLHPTAIERLEREVVVTVVRYPIPLLQRFGSAGTVEDRFIYDLGWRDGIGAGQVNRADFDDRLHLRPGAGERLLEVAGLVRPVVEREWLRHVARRNDDQVDDLRLESFLFGATRTALVHLRDPLLGLQLGRCFYCRGDRGPWEVNHFLPWARWPDDRLDNLVVADRGCNGDKRAALAALSHLERWWRRLTPGTEEHDHLGVIAATVSWPRRADRTAGGARGLYLHQPDGTLLWQAPGEVHPLDARRLQLTFAAVPAAAEDPGDYTP
jgi:5-methylcytosine-specific restriction endonuclease McrA